MDQSTMIKGCILEELEEGWIIYYQNALFKILRCLIHTVSFSLTSTGVCVAAKLPLSVLSLSKTVPSGFNYLYFYVRLPSLKRRVALCLCIVIFSGHMMD